MLFRQYCETCRSYCPAVILFQGRHRVLVFRFFYAFRDYKHGNEWALKKLEERLFQEIDTLNEDR